MSELSADKIAELHVSELEMVQTIIGRHVTYGATLKNYCITLITASGGFAFAVQRPAALLLALVPVCICGLLDAQYLRNERRFRALFHELRQRDWSTAPSFNISRPSSPPEPYRSALANWSIAGFYGPLAAAVVGVSLLAGSLHGSFF